MKASLSNFRQSPRKVRLVANLIRGKSVAQAQSLLTFTPQKSSPEIKKLLASAIANAEVAGQKAENLFVKTIMVDKGTVLRRFKPMARGRAASVRRTMSIIKIELGATVEPVKAKKVAKKAAKKAASVAK